VSLEDFLRRLIRDALHEELRAMGVPDAPLSEISVSSCARDNSMTRAEATRDVYRKVRAHQLRSPAAGTLGPECTDRYQAHRRWRQTSASAVDARRLMR
jgi:hypothetical protein